MLRFPIRQTPRKLSKAMGVDELGRGSGPAGRIERMRIIVTELIRNERLEGMFAHMHEARGYTERLIQIAQKHGDKHKPTMELADYWLKEKDLIHKLFKVIVPRYNNCHTAYTDIYRLPNVYPGGKKELAILELKGNPYPPVRPHTRDIKGSLINVLMSEVRKDFYSQKFHPAARAESSNTAMSDAGQSTSPTDPLSPTDNMSDESADLSDEQVKKDH